MTVNAKDAAERQKSLTSPDVVLFTLDARSIGGSLSRFVDDADPNGAVTSGGLVYAPVPVQSDGWAWRGQGALPTPSITLADIDGILSAELAETGDLQGALVERKRTWRVHLDDGDDPDPDAFIRPLDLYKVERKSRDDGLFVTLELSAAVDQEGKQVPGRQCLRVCTHRYRVWNATTASFDYGNATCPWVGSDGAPGGAEGPFFDAKGVAVADPAADRCGKKLSDCVARFGTGALPFWGFPGVGRNV